MAKIHSVQNTLNGGEFGRALFGRTDIAKYQHAVAEMENFIPMPQGGATRRPGTEYLGISGNDSQDADAKSVLIPFRFSTTEAYILELYWDNNATPEVAKMRVIRNEAFKTTADLTTDSTELVVDYTAGSVTLDIVTDELYISEGHHLNHLDGPFQITSSGAFPDGLAASTDYWVVLPETYTFDDDDIDWDGIDEVDVTSHNFVDGQGPFRLSTTHSLPDVLDTNTDYYLREGSGASEVEFWISQSTAAAGAPGGSQFLMAEPASQDGETHTLAPTDAYKRTRLRLTEDADDPYANMVVLGVEDAEGVTLTLTVTTAVPIEVELPYTQAELSLLQYTQSADVLYLSSPAYNKPPAKISRTGDAEWQYDLIDFLDGPYLREGEGEIAAGTTLAPSQVAVDEDFGNGRVTIDTQDVDHPLFTANDVGRLVRLAHDDGQVGWAKIREYVDPTQVRVNIMPHPNGTIGLLTDGFGSTDPTANWQLGAWGSGPAQGWPVAVSFFEQRLGWGNSPSEPNGFRASRASDYENMSPSDIDLFLTDDASLSYLLGANSVDTIHWLRPIRSLIIGTSDTLYPVQATTFLDPITPGNIQAKPNTARGAGDVVPVVVDDQILYVSRTARAVNGMSYRFDRDSYISEDMTLLAEHMVRSGIVKLSRQMEPNRVVWALRNDGILAAMTLLADQEIHAWSRHTLGGLFGSGFPVVEAMAVIPSPDTTHDQLWLQVKRTVNGATVRSIEFMTPPFHEDSDIDDACFVDMAYRYDSTATTTITYAGNLEHLLGETVEVFADGVSVGSETVSLDTDITLDVAASKIAVGIQRHAYLVPLDLYGAEETLDARMKSIISVTLRTMKTTGGLYGQDSSNLFPFQWDQPDLDSAPTIAEGEDVRLELIGTWERNTNLLITQRQPYPMTILSIITEAEVGSL